MEDKNQAQLLEKLAGKRGGQVVAGLLGNFQSVEDALDNMRNAAGSADDEMQIIEDSLAFKINALKETWVGTLQNLIDSGSLGKLIDGLTKISEALGWIVDKAQLLGTLAIGGSVVAGFKGFDIRDVYSNLTTSQVKIGDELFSVKNKDIDSLNSYVNAVKSGIDPTKALNDNLSNCHTNTKQFATSMLGTQESVKSYSVITKEASIATKALSVAQSMLLNIAVTATIMGTVKLISSLVHASENARAKSKELTDEYIQQKGEINSLSDEYENLHEQLKHCEKDSEEYVQIKSQLLSVQDQLKQKFQDEADGIDLVNGKYEDQIKLLDEAKRKKAEEYIHEQGATIGDVRKFISSRDFNLGFNANGADNSNFDARVNKILLNAGITIDIDDVNSLKILNATRQEAYDIINKAMSDIDKEYGENKTREAQRIYTELSKYLNDNGHTGSTKLNYNDYLDNLDVYTKYAQSQIDANSRYSKVYQELVDAVNQYNDAIASDEGVQEAKSHLDEIADKYDETTKLISTDAQYVKDNLFKDVKTYIPHSKQQSNVATYNNQNASIDMEELSTSVNHAITGYTALNTALSEQATKGTLTSNSIKTLSESFEFFDDMIETTTNGITINTSKMNELNAQYKKNITNKIADKQAALTYKYEQGSKKLATYNKILSSNTNLSKTEIEQLNRLIDAQGNEQQATMNEIGALKALQLEFENTISTHNAFINALESANQGAGYDAIVSSLEKVQEQWNKGLVGTDEIRAFVDYMTSADMSNASVNEIVGAYELAMENAKKYFTETRSGSEQFLELLKQTTIEVNGQSKALANVDANGNWIIAIDDMQKASEACGLSVDFLQDNLRKLQEYGFNIEFTDTTQLRDYAKELEVIDAEIERVQQQLKDGGQYSNQLQQTLNELTAQKHEIEVTLDTQQVEDALSEVATAIEQIQNLQQQINMTDNTSAQMAMTYAQQNIAQDVGITVTQALSMDTSNAEEMYNLLKDSIESDTTTATVDIKPQRNTFDSVMNEIETHPYTANVLLNVSGTIVKTRLQSVIQSVVDKAQNDGNTTQWTGSAYATGKGNWSVGTTSDHALVGELGAELRVRDGHYELLGENGAEFTDVRPDDIIFNHKQTEQILKYGRINSRGQAFVQGSAFNGTNTKVDGSGSFQGGNGGSSSNNNGNNSNSDSSSIAEDAEKAKETFDWVEVLIQRIQEAIQRLEKVVSNTFDSWTNRNTKLIAEVGKVKEEIDIQRKAYDVYIAQANSVGLAEEYAAKVRNGTLQIETIQNNEELVNQINEYQEWYNKAVACQDAVQDLQIQLSELAKTKFDHVQKQFEDILGVIEKTSSILDSRINRRQTAGYFIDSQSYQQMIDYTSQQKATKLQEIVELQQALNEAVASGAIVQGSEAWHEMNAAILDGKNAIEEYETAIVELRKNIRDTNWEIADFTQSLFDQMKQENDFIVELLSNEKLFEDDGRFNEKGLATSEMHIANYELATRKAAEYGRQVKAIDWELSRDPNNKELIERKKELVQAQQESIKAAEAEKQAQKSLVKEGIDIHLNALTKLINKYKESLSSAKDLYDYQKNIKEQTNDIANYEKMVLAYANDTSEEGRKLLQEASNSLKDSKEKLQETEWDRYISETGNLLDDLYTDYEETLNARLDDVDGLIKDTISAVNNNGTTIKEAIETATSRVGYEMKTPMEEAIGSSNVIHSVDIGIEEIKGYVREMLNEATYEAQKMTKQQVQETRTPSNDALTKVTSSTKALTDALKNTKKALGYADGSKKIPYDQLAWTQENGQEIIVRKSDGAILTPLGSGDMVFTNDMTERLWNMAKGNLDFANVKIGSIPRQSVGTVNNENAININLPNVTNYNEFKRELQQDKTFNKFIQEVTFGQALGNNSLNKNKY